MASENLGSTVLHEHRKIVTLRHLLALVNFIAIFASTLITRHFVLIRGTADGILTIINVLCIINIAQILVCISEYVTKVLIGKYMKSIVYLSYALGIIWFLATAAEFAVGSYILGEARIDLGVIAALQLFSAILAYIAWPHIDYATVRKMTHKNSREDLFRRAKNARGGALKYVLVCIMMVVVQLGMLYAYKLSPRVYDLFSESRQLEYQLSEDGQSYEVIGVYRGTSSYVNVPSIYNNKPVTVIKSGALSNEGLYESNKIDRIDIGTETTVDGVTTVESNLLVIESGAIDNDKITSLLLPSSISKIEDGAVSSSSLKTITYEAKADFSYSYLDCDSLNTVTFNGEDAGKIVSLEGMSSNVTLEVSKDSYNSYREKNKEYMSSIRPILDSTEFVVDFYTGTDYYIESIFCKVGQEVQLGYQDLQNSKFVDKTAPSKDTLAYIKDRNEMGTDGAKENSAFRGWYFDNAFTEECRFTETGKVAFDKDTLLYAKWIDEYTGTLDWGTYHPDGQPQTLYWTNENLTKFPVILDRDGFERGIVWSVDGQTVTSSQNISKSVTVSGEWLFDLPTADINPTAQKENNFVVSTDKDSVTFTYDESQILHLEAMMHHEMENEKDFSYSTHWRREGDDNFSNQNRILDLSEVKESGVYILTVTATSPYNDKSSVETRVNVEIMRKELNISGAELNNKTVEYNSGNFTLTCDGNPADSNVDILFSYYDYVTGEMVAGHEGVKNAGRYKVVATFQKDNDFDRDNYTTKELNAELTITKCELGFDGWSANEFTYNTQEQGVYLKVNKQFPGDIVELIYENNKATDAGEYVAKVVGVNNPNYSISNMTAANNCTHTWKINPKEITVKEWKLDGSVTSTFKITYNGKEHTLEAVADGVYKTDESTLKFIYDDSANKVKATNANKYTAKIIGVENENYVLVSGSTQEWEIEKKALTVVFDSATGLVYDGTLQGVTATVKGIATKDLDSFSAEKFLYDGISANLTVSEPVKSGANLLITFTAKDAASYVAKLSGINTSEDVSLNYTLVPQTREFSISPKTITVVENDADCVYTGKNQSLTVSIMGLVEADLDSITYDQFTTKNLNNGSKGEGCYLLSLTAKDAGDYPYEVTAFSNSNYNIVVKTGNLTVKKKTLSVNWQIKDLASEETALLSSSNALHTYNAKGYEIIANVMGLVGNEDVSLTYTNQVAVNVGRYTTLVSLPESYGNYSLPNTAISWEIEPYKVNFTWKFNGKLHPVADGVGPEFEYSATNVDVTPVYTLLGTDTIDITYAYGKNDISKIDAANGTYKVEISSLGNSNYTVGDNGSFDWKITPKTVTVTWVDTPSSVVYNGAYTGPQFRISGIIENDRTLYVRANNNNAYMTVASLDSATKYDFKTSRLIINASEYLCNVDAVCKLIDGLYYRDNNYQISCEARDYTVNKAPLTLNGWMVESGGVKSVYDSATSLIYNRSYYVLTNSIKETLFNREGVTDTVYLEFEDNSKMYYSDSGYVAKAKLAGTNSANYYLDCEDSVSWRIEKKAVAIQWVTNSFVYDGYRKEQSATYESGATNADDLKVYDGDYLELSYENNIAYNAGEYTAKIVGLSVNYKLVSNESYSWQILPREIHFSELVWDYTNTTYNGKTQYPRANYNGNYIGEYDYPDSAKNANTTTGYVIYAKEFESGNYKLVGENDPGYVYYISPKIINFTWGFDNSKTNAGNITYDGKERVVNAYHDALSGDTVNLTYTVTGASSDRKIKNAGDYTFTVIGIDNANYALSQESSRNVSKTLKVSPKSVTFSWYYGNDTTKTAGNFTYDGNSKTINAVVNGVCTGDTVNVTYAAGQSRTITNAGSYTFSVESLSNPNYQLPSESNCKKSVVINKQTLTAVWTGNTTVDYDGKSHALTVKLTGTIAGSAITVTPVYTTANSFVDAGSYTIYAGMGSCSNTKFDEANFQLPSNYYTTLKINRQVLDLTWSGVNSVVYDGNSHTLEAKLTGKINGRSVTVSAVYSSNGNSKINQGSYTFSVSSIGTSSDAEFKAANFQLPGTKSTTLTILPQPVTITWIGEANIVYDGDEHLLTPVIKAKNNGVTVDITSTAGYTTDRIKNVGSYTYTISYLNNSNYTLDGATGNKSMTLTVSPQPVTITWSNDKFVYDGNNHSLTPVVTGSNDGVSISSTYLTYTTSTYKNVGTYNYTLTKINDSNYTLNGATGSITKSMTITPQKVRIEWQGAGTYTYTGQTYTLKPYIYGINTGASVSYNGNGTSSFINAGTYTYEITSLSNINYTLEGCQGSTSATTVITPAEVTITWSGDTTVTYDGKTHYLTATVTDESGKTVTVTYQNNVKGGTAVGTYTIIINLSSNYKVKDGSSTTAILVIKQA